MCRKARAHPDYLHILSQTICRNDFGIVCPQERCTALYVDHIHFMIRRISSLISSVGLPAFTALFRKFSNAVLIRRTSLGLNATTTFFSFFQNTITTCLFLLCYRNQRRLANVQITAPDRVPSASPPLRNRRPFRIPWR